MLDTNQHFQQKQIEIIMSKTEEERVRMGIDMMETAYAIVKNSIKLKKPELTERGLVAAIFKQYYQNDFKEDKLNSIIEGILKFSYKPNGN